MLSGVVDSSFKQILSETENQSETTFLIYGANHQTIYVTPLQSHANDTQPRELAFSHAVQQALHQQAGQLTWGNTE